MFVVKKLPVTAVGDIPLNLLCIVLNMFFSTDINRFVLLYLFASRTDFTAHRNLNESMVGKP
jgi:hypothetical protein